MATWAAAEGRHATGEGLWLVPLFPALPRGFWLLWAKKSREGGAVREEGIPTGCTRLLGQASGSLGLGGGPVSGDSFLLPALPARRNAFSCWLVSGSFLGSTSLLWSVCPAKVPLGQLLGCQSLCLTRPVAGPAEAFGPYLPRELITRQQLLCLSSADGAPGQPTAHVFHFPGWN